jgi:5-methylcytosine-specific restriction protein B
MDNTIPYTLADCAAETGWPEEELQRWVGAIYRKGQAILYGPPGTGKTFMAQKLAQHITGQNGGFWELVQFHPAYTYEAFVQGIRPFTDEAGRLHYKLVHGRFRQFCARAASHTGPCVLIIDEINRANLATVFGELMYLLEYRQAAVELAEDNQLTARFRIPPNVYLIGTMNTADRSIALVDHALRRRFAFIHLPPNEKTLRHFHQQTGYNPNALIKIVERVNRQIADPHYAIGYSFFMHPELPTHLEDIWGMEIEPYLEEYFFDQPDQVDLFRWSQIEKELRD